MTIHYHGTPITPNRIIMKMVGAHFCVSHAAPEQIRRCHKIGQSVMLDNGAFSVWKRGHVPDWGAYYRWSDRWLDYPTTWAVIPDEIEGDEDANRRLVDQWPHGKNKGAPVWHMHESFHRLLDLAHRFPRICIGSSGEYAEVMSSSWQRRMDAAWDEISRVFRRPPNIHMLRGLRLATERWPFASLDSTNIARNHAGSVKRPRKCAHEMMHRLDSEQCPSRFVHPDEQWEVVL